MRKFIFSDILWGLALATAALFFYFTGTALTLILTILGVEARLLHN